MKFKYSNLIFTAFLFAGIFSGCDKIDHTEIPSVNTTRVTGITARVAESGGIIADSGTAPVTRRGVVWNTTGNPGLYDREGLTVDGSGTGQFVSLITGLTPGTTYYVRSYAQNHAGVAYGDQVSFTTIDENDRNAGSLEDIDGNGYRSVLIGEIEWMAENLMVTHYNDGEPIPELTDNDSWANASSGAFAVYPHEAIDSLKSMCEVLRTYGVLYNWYAVETGRLCPDGWRVPGDGDWKFLEGYVDGEFGIDHSEWDRQGWRGHDAGQRLRAGHDFGFSLKSEVPVPVVGTDDFDFTALAGGFRNFIGPFHEQGIYGYWWTSTTADDGRSWIRGMGFLSDVLRDARGQGHGFSVRCIRDYELN